MLRIWHKVFPIPLHAPDCRGTFDDINKMLLRLKRDPESLERLQKPTFRTAYTSTYPLHDAVETRHPECVRFLLNSGANPDLLDPRANSALGLLIYLFNPEISVKIAEILLKYGASLNRVHSKYTFNYFMKYLVTNHRNELLKLFLETGCPVDDPEDEWDTWQQNRCESQFGDSPLGRSLLSDNNEAFRLLFLHGASTTYADSDTQYVSIAIKIIGSVFPKDRFNLHAFIIFTEFGGNLWLPSWISKETVLDLLKYRLIKENFQKESRLVKKIVRNPLRLKSLSRNSLRSHFNRDYFKFVSTLQIPKVFIDFLLYEDLIVIHY